jgi:phosphotransferase system  glucose/maltose/N-acetylglucosamine-specific IIC component
MRRGFGIGAAILTVIVLVIVGAIAYNIGWSAGVGTHLPDGATNVPPGYYYGYGGWHAGFGIFGFLWFLLILFGVFWLFRLAFWGRRWRGGWYGPGMGGGHHYGSFEERAQEWHRRQHGEQPSGTATPPPPPDTRSV